MILSKNKNIPENDKCIICKNYITISDIENNNFELSITKRKQKYMHIKLVLKGVIKMELEIEDKLQEKYKYIDIEVKYLDLRKYQINVKIKIEDQEYKKEIIHIWDAHYTFDVNIGTICNQIDNYILKIFRKEN